MTHLSDLWQKRFNFHLNEIGKYGRLIFNDHFSIILLILLAFGSLYYRELFEQVRAVDPVTVRIPIIAVASFFLAMMFQLGRPIWYTKDPDKSYLFARGHEWDSYWLKGTLLGVIVPAILLALSAVIAFPFLTLVTAWSNNYLLLFIIGLILFKIISFLLLYLNIYGLGLGRSGVEVQQWVHTLLFAIAIVIILAVPSPWNLIIPGLLIIALGVYIAWAFTQRAQRPIHFTYVIDQEVQRESTFYKTISIFADVPHMKPAIKRRSYLDRILTMIPTLNHNRYSYLYIRMLFRNSTYSGIWLRIMVFVAVLIALMESFWMAVITGMLGYLMTIVQLVPMMYDYEKQPFQQIYPNRAGSRAEAFQITIAIVFGLQTVVYVAVLLIFFPFQWYLAWIIIGWLITMGLLIFAYVPWWNHRYLKKRDK